MTAVATLIREIEDQDWIIGEAGLYKLDPPFKGHTYVIIISSVTEGYFCSCEEVVMFDSNEQCQTAMYDLAHLNGTMSHELLLQSCGYQMKVPRLEISDKDREFLKSVGWK